MKTELRCFLFQHAEQKGNQQNHRRIQLCQPCHDDRRKSDTSGNCRRQRDIRTGRLHHAADAADSAGQKHRPQNHFFTFMPA